MRKTDPFTRTPGVAGAAFIDMHYADEIIQTFKSPDSSKFIYKIVGLRGSGKSVEFRKIINTFAKTEGWLVYTLSAAGDPTSALISMLSREKFINDKKYTTTISAGGNAGAKGLMLHAEADLEVRHSIEKNISYYSAEAELAEMIQKANDGGYNVLVAIDDIARTPDMVKFLSIWGTMLLDDRKHIYFVCTGLSKNIEDFTAEPNLTFFKRSDPIETGPLNKYEIASMYQKLLNIDETEAVELSKLTCGYAYAYQVLGSLYFNKKQNETLQDILSEYDKVLFSDSYDLIWRSLTEAEQQFVRLILASSSGKASDIKEQMSHSSGYDSLRDRLRNKHLINTQKRGYISIDLPRFKEYVQLWHS